MKRRRSNRAGFHEPSMVPLADMLTNTVGIMMFILIFTVLAAGGVILPKRLPMEHKTSARPVTFVCIAGRVLPEDDSVIDEFLKPLGRPTFDTVDSWIKRFNARQVANEYFDVKGEGEVSRSFSATQIRISFDVTVVFTPRIGRGETPAELQRAGSVFRRSLSKYSAQDYFIHFMVYPDSLAAFEAARGVALETKFSTGWTPIKSGKPLRFSLSGNGREATVDH